MGSGSARFHWIGIQLLASWATHLVFLPFAIVNTLVGFVIIVYILIPIVHWSNIYDAKKFPLISTHVFDSTGQIYNISRVLNQETFDLNVGKYESYSKLYMSTTFAMNYGFSFATLTAAISHVILFHGRVHIETTAELLEQQLAKELSNMTLEEALSLARTFSHYLNLMGTAETHHRGERLLPSGKRMN